MRISDWSSDVCSSDLLHEVAVRRRRDAHQLMTGKRSPPMGAHGFIVEWSKFGHGEPFQQTSSGCATRIHDHRGRSVRFSPAPWMVRWVWTVMSPTSYCKIGRASGRERVCQYV